jgi:hypothetical protein
VRFGDVLELTHPDAGTAVQGALDRERSATMCNKVEQ